MENPVKSADNAPRLQCRPPRLLVAALLSVLLVALLAACQPVQPRAESGSGAGPDTASAGASAATIPEVQIAVDDEQFTIPAEVPGGIVRVVIRNNSSQDLDISLARILESGTEEQIRELLLDSNANFVPLLQLANPMLGFFPVAAGSSQAAIVDLRTGDFVLDATAHSDGPTPPGQAHVFGAFSADTLVGTVEPQADVKVEMSDFAFVLPDTVPAGTLLWEYHNTGEQWHLQAFVQPSPGMTQDEVLAALMAEGMPAGPPPFTFVNNAGIPPIGPGERVWLELALEPGSYLAVCPLPDMAAILAGGAPTTHVAHGMHRLVTVE